MAKHRVTQLCLLPVGFLLVLAASAGAQGGGAVAQRFERNRDFRGFVQSITTRPGDPATWIGTKSRLYRLDAQAAARPVEVASQPARGQQLLLPPGGGTFLWLRPAGGGLMTMQGFSVPQRGVPPTPIPTPDLPFADVHVGPDLALFLTGTPTEDTHAGRGPFRYALWDAKGDLRRSFETEQRRRVVIGPRGEAVALIGPDETSVYDEAGELLWQLDGHFRDVALSERGAVAVASSGDPGQVDEVVIRGRGQGLRNLRAPTPVHRIEIERGGARALLVGSDARIFLLDTGSGELHEGPGIAPGGSGAVISDAALLDEGSMLVGLLMAQGEGGPDAPSPGRVVLVSREGDVLFQQDVRIPERVAGSPAVHAEPGAKRAFAWTRDELFVVALP